MNRSYVSLRHKYEYWGSVRKFILKNLLLNHSWILGYIILFYEIKLSKALLNLDKNTWV